MLQAINTIDNVLSFITEDVYKFEQELVNRFGILKVWTNTPEENRKELFLLAARIWGFCLFVYGIACDLRDLWNQQNRSEAVDQALLEIESDLRNREIGSQNMVITVAAFTMAFQESDEAPGVETEGSTPFSIDYLRSLAKDYGVKNWHCTGIEKLTARLQEVGAI